MGRCDLWVLSLSSLAACGPDVLYPAPLVELEPLELEPICGQPSPFRLLELDEDQALVDRDSAVYRFQDRLYFLVGQADEYSGLQPHELGMEPTLYSTGPCGESPRLIAANIWSVLEHPRWPGLLLGQSDGDLVVIDPQGEVEPRVLIEDVPYATAWTEHGMLEVDDDREALVLRSYPTSPDDPEPEPTVLVEPFAHDTSRAYHAGEVFFVEDGAVHRIDVRDGSRAVELSVSLEIEGIQVIADGRFIVWQTPADGDGARSVAIHDRVSGVDTWLGSIDTYIDHRTDHFVLSLGGIYDPTQRLVLLPSLEVIDVPRSVVLSERIDDTRWLAWSRTDGWFIHDLTTGSIRSLFDGVGETWFFDDRIEVLIAEGPGSGLTGQGPMYAAWFDGRGEERIVDQAAPGLHRLADGRIVTPLDAYDRTLGTLALSGLDGVTRWALDTEVLTWFEPWQAGAGFEDDVVVYGVSDGDRSGVWLARLPPAE